MTARLKGEVAIVTGAAQGIGADIAKRLVAEGANVVMTDVNNALGSQLAQELGGAAIFLKHDVSNVEEWAYVVAQTKSAFGSVSILVNNAGVAGPVTSTADISVEDYDNIVKIDQYSVFYGMRAVIPTMALGGGGSIVNIASVAGKVAAGNSPNVAYSAAKFALRGMTRQAAVEYGSSNIRVNVVFPGGIATPLSDSVVAEQGEGYLRAFEAKVPLGRRGRPSEIAQLVLFLVSDESSYITGGEYVIDGGLTA